MRDNEDARDRSYDSLEVPGATRAFLRSILPRTRNGMFLVLGGFALGEVIALAGFLAGSSFWLWAPVYVASGATAIALPGFRRGRTDSSGQAPGLEDARGDQSALVEKALFGSATMGVLLGVAGLSLALPTALAVYDVAARPAVRSEPARRATEYVYVGSRRRYHTLPRVTPPRVRTSPAPGYSRHDGVALLDPRGQRVDFIWSYALWLATGGDEPIQATVERTPYLGYVRAASIGDTRDEADVAGAGLPLATACLLLLGLAGLSFAVPGFAAPRDQ